MDLQPNKIDGIVKPITNTRISASEWNQLVGSCMAFITAAGFTPDADDNSQFLNAFIQIAQNMGALGANVDLSNLSATGENKFTAKANTGLDNITQTGKDNIIDCMTPDYASAISATTVAPGGWATFEVPSDGVILTSYAAATMYLSTSSSQADVYAEFSTPFLPVKKGMFVCILVASGAVGYFAPYKGADNA